MSRSSTICGSCFAMLALKDWPVQNKKYAEKGLNKQRLDYLLDRIIRLEQTLAPSNGTPPRYTTYEDSRSKIPELARPPENAAA